MVAGDHHRLDARSAGLGDGLPDVFSHWIREPDEHPREPRAVVMADSQHEQPPAAAGFRLDELQPCVAVGSGKRFRKVDHDLGCAEQELAPSAAMGVAEKRIGAPVARCSGRDEVASRDLGHDAPLLQGGHDRRRERPLSSNG